MPSDVVVRVGGSVGQYVGTKVLFCVDGGNVWALTTYHVYVIMRREC